MALLFEKLTLPLHRFFINKRNNAFSFQKNIY